MKTDFKVSAIMRSFPNRDFNSYAKHSSQIYWEQYIAKEIWSALQMEPVCFRQWAIV